MIKIVKVFSTKDCPYCFGLKEFLRNNNVEFEDINGEIIIGFDKKKIINFLEIKI